MIPVLDKPRLPIIPYGPGMQYANEAAVIAAFPVGTPVYDMAETVEANRMKRIRYVAELNGPDTVNAGSTRQIAESPFIQFTFRDVNPGVSTIGRIARVLNGANLIAFIYVDTAGKLNVQIRQSDGATVVTTIQSVSSVFANGSFHKAGIIFSATECTIFVDGAFDKTGSIPAWNVTQLTKIELYDADADVRPVQFANLRITSTTPTVDCWELSESSGTTLANQCNPSNPATLTDSTAHAKTCVPLSLGG